MRHRYDRSSSRRSPISARPCPKTIRSSGCKPLNWYSGISKCPGASRSRSIRNETESSRPSWSLRAATSWSGWCRSSPVEVGEVSQCTVTGMDWISEALRESGLGPETAVSSHVDGIEDGLLLLFAFRVTLVSDEKRERFHLVAVSPVDGSTWPVDPDRPDRGLVPHPSPGIRPDLEAAYRLATESLRTTTGVEVERFRTRSLGLLEEEVRRIFGYFDRTIEGLRESDPGGSQDLLRAVMAERDRRLTEAVERFDPKASASLCSIRAILVPTARLAIGFPDGTGTEASVDAWSRGVRGLSCGACGRTDGPWRWSSREALRCATCASTPSGSARPRGRPRSDTPRRGTRAGEASVRSPRGSKARSRGASSGRRRP